MGKPVSPFAPLTAFKIEKLIYMKETGMNTATVDKLQGWELLRRIKQDDPEVDEKFKA
jgi:hypothetical protein